MFSFETIHFVSAHQSYVYFNKKGKEISHITCRFSTGLTLLYFTIHWEHKLKGYFVFVRSIVDPNHYKGSRFLFDRSIRIITTGSLQGEQQQLIRLSESLLQGEQRTAAKTRSILQITALHKGNTEQQQQLVVRSIVRSESQGRLLTAATATRFIDRPIRITKGGNIVRSICSFVLLFLRTILVRFKHGAGRVLRVFHLLSFY